MKKFIHFALFFLFLFQTPNIFAADITSEDAAKSIKKSLKHPYLYFTDEEKPAILNRIKTDTDSRYIMDRQLAEANRYLYMPVEKSIPREIRDSRFDLSDNTLQIWGQYRDAAYTLAFVYQMTGEEKYAKKAFEFADVICDMDTWVGRACQFPKAYPRVSPWNVKDDKVIFTYDIYASDNTIDMAAVYDWIYPVLNKAQKDRIRGALLEKAIVQVRGHFEAQWWSTAYRCNWCTWCCSGIGLAALTLLVDDPDLTDIVAETYNRTCRTLDNIGDEGGWQEGCSYWGQTLRMSILYADALKRVTDNKLNIFAHPKIAKNTVNFALYNSVPPHYAVNFADAGFHETGSSRLYNKLAIETGSPEAAWYRKNHFGEGSDIFDVIWPLNTVTPGLPAQTSMHFSNCDWVIMRSDFTNIEKVMIACKAGKSDDPHHGHLDIGQFMVYWKGKGYICDLGTADYDEKYFDAEKYDTPQASSVGHNLIFVNGERQIPGKLKDKPLNEKIGGKVIEFRPGKNRDYTLMDPSDAYPKKELKQWRRHIILEKPVVTVVVDEVESQKSGAEVEARFHSDCEQIVKDGYTLIHGKDGDMALIPVTEEKFNFRPDRHAYLALQKQAKFKWIPYNGTVVNIKKDRTVLAHIILPVKDESEAKTIVKSAKRSYGGSGDFELLFIKDGKAYKYKFKKSAEGLVLE